MRVKVEEHGKTPLFGEFVGLYVDENQDTCAMVRCDGYGLFLKGVHPSRVTIVTPEEEASYRS